MIINFICGRYHRTVDILKKLAALINIYGIKTDEQYKATQIQVNNIKRFLLKNDLSTS